MTQKDYIPQDVFAGDAPPQESPRVMIAPARYIQGEGVLDHLGRYLSLINCTSPALLITEGGLKRVGDRVLRSLQQVQIKPLTLLFKGECSDEEVDRHVKSLRGRPTDALIAVGGGKCLDTGKCVASCISAPVIICPTLASTDAPCSAVSVMYTPEGAFDRPWFFMDSPALVVVDTGVIVRAPARHLVAGMGDAMSTYYETRTCFLNPEARNMVGARPTAAAMAIAERGAKLLFENGVKALKAVKKSEVNEAVENVVEANTLLSGIGFESGGLAASHGVAQVFPAIPFLHEQYLHGEMVAIGVLVHLCLEDDRDEAKRVASFFAQVGLPVHLAQLSLDPKRNAHEFDLVINEAANDLFIHHEPFEITPQKIKGAILQAHSLGLEVLKKVGDEAYRSLHPEA